MSEPWERQPGESGKAFEAFCGYRDLGPRRSIRRFHAKLVAEGRAVAVRLLERWSADWRWVERAAAWDAEVDRQARATALDEAAEMARRDIQIAQAFKAKVVQHLASLQLGELNPTQMAKWFEVAVKVEREARGLAGDTVEVKSSTAEDQVAWARRIASDPEARRLALDLFDRLAAQSSDRPESLEAAPNPYLA